LPYATALSQNYPNPFNPQTTIAFSIAHRSYVHLAVYDVRGALVRTLADEPREAGAHAVKWDGRNENGNAVASGVYFYQLRAGDFSKTRKMVLLK
jgi:flagellar hook assembly protein FlgD